MRATRCFVLTSDMEGGTPNVYAEALNHGCKFIVSNIDADEEITNYGELGEIYTCNDIDGLSKCLLNLNVNNSVESFQSHIPKALEYAKSNFDWRKNIKKNSFYAWKLGIYCILTKRKPTQKKPNHLVRL